MFKPMEKHLRWKGGRVYDDDGYIMLKMPEHPDSNNHGYVREHRLVMEKHLGRRLNPKEYIHHINGIRDDNRVENMQIVTWKEHLIIHRGKREEMKSRFCVVCDSNKTYVAPDGRPNWYRVEGEFYCKKCWKRYRRLNGLSC